MHPYKAGKVITPNDATLVGVQALLVGGATDVVNVAVKFRGNAVAITLPLRTGVIHDLDVDVVMATNTTAVSVIGLTR